MGIKVLVFGMTDKLGGIETFLMNYCRELHKSGFDFDFLCNTEKVARADEISELGGTIYRVPMRSKNPSKFKKALHLFFDEHRGEYDVFWQNVNSLVNIDYLIEAKHADIPMRIIHCHNGNDETGSKVRLALHYLNRIQIQNYATDFWACSDSAAQWFFNERITSRSLYRVVPDAFNVGKMRFDSRRRCIERKERGWDNDLIIGNVGRLERQKNQDLQLSILRVLLQRDERYRLVLIGKGNRYRELKNKAVKLGISDRVIFLGECNEVSSLYQAMDLFLFPSLFEGLGIALVEAQASGLPCVISDMIPEDARLNANLIVCSLEDSPEVWANAIERAIGARCPQESNRVMDSAFNIDSQSKILNDVIKKRVMELRNLNQTVTNRH